MRDLAESVYSRSHGGRRIVILYANFYDICMLLLPIMGVGSEDYHVNAQAQSVPRQSDVPAGIFDLAYHLRCADILIVLSFSSLESGGSVGI
jgi:hypothetical protein